MHDVPIASGYSSLTRMRLGRHLEHEFVCISPLVNCRIPSFVGARSKDMTRKNHILANSWAKFTTVLCMGKLGGQGSRTPHANARRLTCDEQVGDVKFGNYMGKDAHGNKYYENKDYPHGGSH